MVCGRRQKLLAPQECSGVGSAYRPDKDSGRGLVATRCFRCISTARASYGAGRILLNETEVLSLKGDRSFSPLRNAEALGPPTGRAVTRGEYSRPREAFVAFFSTGEVLSEWVCL